MKLTNPLLGFPKKDIAGEDVVGIEYDGACVDVAKSILDLLLTRIDKVRKMKQFLS